MDPHSERVQRLTAGGPTILAIDDDPTMLDLYAGLLDQFVCRFFPAICIEDGIQIAATLPVHIVLLDMIFPATAKRGVDFMRWRHETGRAHYMRVAIISGLVGPADVEEARMFGGFYIAARKPCTQQELFDILTDSGITLHRKQHGQGR